MKPSELLDRAIKHSQLQSKYALHKLTGIGETTISKWANDKAWPSNDAVATLAELAGLDVWETICALEYQRTEDEARKTRWAGFLAAARAKTSHLAALVLGWALVVLAAFGGGQSQAAELGRCIYNQCRIIGEYVVRSRRLRAS